MEPTREQQIEGQSIPEIHRGNQILWFALLTGGFLITCILYFQMVDHSNFYDQEKFLGSIFMPVAVILTIATFAAARFLMGKRKEAASKVTGLKNKLIDFRQNFVLNAALHEGPTLFCIVLMMLENNGYFLLLAAVNWLLLFTTRPTLEKFKEWYSLTSEEKQELKAAFPNQVV